MDLRGDMAPELKDVQNGCSWIPTTPAKPDSTTQQPIMTMCNFHSPTKTNTNSTTVKSVLSSFEPLTPEKLGKAGPESAMSYLSQGEMHIEEDARVNKILSDKVKEFLSCATNSTQLPENHKPDKEGAEETELRKTPNPKPRKKRHRPKVIVEGQPKKTPKPAPENLAYSSGTTKVKRKYDRKKGANHLNNTSLEGVKSETDSNKSPNSKDTPIEKRKFDEGSIDAANGKLVRLTRNSCRRSLNFELESQEKDKGSSYCPSSNRDIKSQEENLNAKDHLKATMQCKHGMEAAMEKTDMGVSYESACFGNQVLKDYQSKPERHSLNLLPHAKMFPLQDDCTLTDERVATRGKCQIVFSNVTHDKEENAVQVTINPDCQLTSSIPNDSNCSNSKCLNTERNERTYKRQRVDNAVRAKICSTNATGIFYNSLQTCSYKLSQNTYKNDGTPNMHFPVFYNNVRTETGDNTATCSLQFTMMTSGNHENPEKQPLRDTTTAVKEQSNMCNCNGFINLMGSPVAAKFRYVSTSDAITEQLNKLDLKSESNHVSARDHSAIVAYHKYYQEQHALVPYQRGGTVIPFYTSFNQVKRRRPRPKVELDDETIRVWQLLLENINSEGIDGNDEEKTKWWEEERRVFSGRADSFIARMHLVQGNLQSCQIDNKISTLIWHKLFPATEHIDSWVQWLNTNR